MTNDKDRYRKSTIAVRGFRGLSAYSEPVFADGGVFIFDSRRGTTTTIDVLKYNIDFEGRLADFKPIATWDTDKPHKFFTTCVYNGRFYLFCDDDGGGWKYGIHYYTSADGKDWTKGTIDLDLAAEYARFGLIPSAPKQLRAVVFDDRIYLLYWRAGRIYFATFNGKTCQEIRALPPNLEPLFAVTPVLHKNKPALAWCGVLKGRDSHLQLYFIHPPDDGGCHAVERRLEIEGNWTEHDNQMSMAHGSVQGGRQANALQIFLNNTGHIKQLRRVGVDLETLEVQGWFDTAIQNRASKYNARCDALAVPAPFSTTDFRNYIVVHTVLDVSSTPKMQISAYLSDVFSMTHQAKDLDTGMKPLAGEKSYHDRGAWTLVGVIEGLPPFTRNGQPSPLETSSFQYGESATTAIEISNTFETSVGLTLGVGVEKIGGVTADLVTSFSSTNMIRKTIVKTFNIMWNNTERNRDGERGFLLYIKPYLSNRMYKRESSDGTVDLGRFAVTWISDISIGHSVYSLEDPGREGYQGIGKRPRSSDIGGWKDIQFVDYPGIQRHRLNKLEVNTSSGRMEVGMAIERVKQQTTSGKFEFKLTNELLIKGLFKLGSTTSLSFQSQTTISSAITKHIHAALRLPPPPDAKAPPVERMSVTPVWYLPEKDLVIEPDKRPHWIPDRDFQRSVPPWCISWRADF